MFRKLKYTIIILFTCLYLTTCIKETPITVEPQQQITNQDINPRGISRVAPLLRLDTGMHSAPIRSIDVDAAERYLVTGSSDKTVRVWSLPDGRLLRVLRPPIGEGNEGRIDAVAISPNGQTVAIAGITGYQWDRKVSIYLFNRATGELRQRITGHPNIILHLDFSPDGHYLVASLYGKNGIRVYNTSNYRLETKDTDYDDSSYWAEFSRQGQLVTTCHDGYIRLYDQNFKQLAKRIASGGKKPFTASFSPQGDKIAVGFFDSTKVNVLSGNDLKLLYRPDTQGVNNGNLDKIAWSANGRGLYAAGLYQNAKGGLPFPILYWSSAENSRYRALPASFNTIMGIRALRDGSIVFGTQEPVLGLFSASGQKIMEQRAGIADFRGVFYHDSFRLSKDGRSVQFAYKYGGKSTANFSINKRLLTLNPSFQSQLRPPRTQASGLNITGWEDSSVPKLNGKVLALKLDEISRSLAIAPDGQHFLLGTEWYLRLFNKQGELQWKIPVPGSAWGVNIAANGKVAVAAFGDGTLRWYRLRDGEELLALFPHADGKRWIIWTPQGYYAASSGGEALIGWHLNNGIKQAADFFPAARFRDNYYRPDMVAKVLDTLNPEKALHLANKEAGRSSQPQKTIQKQLPPVVTLLSPQDLEKFYDTKIKLRYSVRRPSKEPITGIKVLIDGRPLENTKGLQRVRPKFNDETEQSLEITLPARDVEVSLIVENKYAASEPTTVRLRWQGASKLFQKPTLYVLAIGVGKFDNPSISTLKYAHQDAQDIVELFKGQKTQGLYENIQVKLLKESSKAEILQGLEWINNKTTQNDVAIVSISGHGYNDEKGDYYFIPRDIDPNNIQTTAVPYQKLKKTMSTLLGKALFFIDTCHAGNVMGKNRGVADVNKVANDLSSSENGVIVYTASTGAQLSLEDPKWKNGAFTEALLEGLHGQGDYTKDKKINTKELDLYVSERVMELTKGRQTPTTAIPQTIVSFPIVFLR
jgi:WD40 repeat protein